MRKPILPPRNRSKSDTKVRAPASGTVYSIEVKATEFVEQGKLLLQLADLHHERVRAYFDEPEIGNLAVGQPIEIKWDARPGRTWHGHIERVPVTVIHLETRTVGEVLVAIDDPDGELLPDTNVTVTVTTSSQPNALSMPREALHMENGKPYVFRVGWRGAQTYPGGDGNDQSHPGGNPFRVERWATGSPQGASAASPCRKAFR